MSSRIINKIPGVRNKPHELWAKFENYLISNKGRWYSLYAKKLMPQFKNSSGYYRASLRVNGKRKHIFTHIKVIELFGDCNGNRIPEGVTSLFALGLSIDHLNTNKKDNRVDNLELVTHQINCIRRSQCQRGGVKSGRKRKIKSIERNKSCNRSC